MESKAKQLKELESIPWVGKKTAARYWDIGIKKPSDLKNKNPEKIYQKMSGNVGYPMDKCMLYVIRANVYYVSHKKHDPKKLYWWYWKEGK